jgi:hypothetical protein
MSFALSKFHERDAGKAKRILSIQIQHTDTSLMLQVNIRPQ